MEQKKENFCETIIDRDGEQTVVMIPVEPIFGSALILDTLGEGYHNILSFNLDEARHLRDLLNKNIPGGL